MISKCISIDFVFLLCFVFIKKNNLFNFYRNNIVRIFIDVSICSTGAVLEIVFNADFWQIRRKGLRGLCHSFSSRC